MKKILLSLLAAFLFNAIHAQFVADHSNDLTISNASGNSDYTFYVPVYKTAFGKNSEQVDHLKKSRAQKTWGFILAGVGIGVITIAATTQNYVDAFTGIAYEKNTASPVAYAVGGACVVSGIVLFAASAKNKRKATSTSFIFKMEKSIATDQHLKMFNSYPAAVLSIGLR